MRVGLAFAAVALLLIGSFAWRHVKSPQEAREAGQGNGTHTRTVQPPQLEADGADSGSTSTAGSRPAITDGDAAQRGRWKIEWRVTGLVQTRGSGWRAARGPVRVRVEAEFFAGDDWVTLVESPVMQEGAGEYQHADGWRPRPVRLTVDHPGYMLLQREVRPNEFRAREGSGPVARVSLPLIPACGLAGQVLLEDGAPVAGAELALLADVPFDADQRIVDRTESDKEGRWHLRGARGGKFLVVVADRGRQPIVSSVVLRDNELIDVPALVLRRGAVISGTLRFGGEPGSGAHLFAEPAATRRGPAFRVLEHELARTADGVDFCPEYDDRPTRRGGFRLSGLSPGAWRLRVERGDSSILLHRDVVDQFQRDVVAPAKDIVFDVPVGWFEINVTVDGEPAGETIFGLASYFDVPGAGPDEAAVWDVMRRMTDSKGHMRIAVSPGQRYGLVVHGEEDAQHHQELTAPDAGETLVVQVERPKPSVRPGLEVTFTGPGADTLEAAHITTLPEQPLPEGSILPGLGKAARVLKGVAHLERVQPLPWLYVVPGGGGWTTRSLWLPIVEEMRWPTTGTKKVTVKLVAGAGLDLEVRAPDGGHANVDIKLLDAGGNDTKTSWVQRLESGGAMINGSGIEMPARAFPPLKAGAYTLVVSKEGLPPLEKELQLAAGENHRIELVYGD